MVFPTPTLCAASAALGSNRSAFRVGPDGLIARSRKFSHPRAPVLARLNFLQLRPVKTVQAKGCPPAESLKLKQLGFSR